MLSRLIWVLMQRFNNNSMLRVEGLITDYGVIRALKGISFEVHQGEIVALLGGNGAGKTTTVMTLMGILHPSMGRIIFEGNEIQRKSTEYIVKLGFALVPEGRQVFGKLTVIENLQMGGYTVRDRNEFMQRLQEVYKIFPQLEKRSKQRAATLSGGEQQMLAIGRALMQKPRFLMLDEPSMGLSPVLMQNIFQAIRKINKAGVTIFLVEQKATMALHIADRGYVLETGQIVLEGTRDKLVSNSMVRRAYLGLDQ